MLGPDEANITDSICGNDTHFTLEFPNGTVLSGTAVVSSVERNFPYDRWMDKDFEFVSVKGRESWEVSLVGVGELRATNTAWQEIALAKGRNEWRCPYCERIHARAAAERRVPCCMVRRKINARLDREVLSFPLIRISL